MGAIAANSCAIETRNPAIATHSQEITAYRAATAPDTREIETNKPADAANRREIATAGRFTPDSEIETAGAHGASSTLNKDLRIMGERCLWGLPLVQKSHAPQYA